MLQRMVRVVAHRGPDEQAYAKAPASLLGFTRLSLVDPEAGGQPFYSPDGNIVLIANGEVYNHHELSANLKSGVRMRSSSDCEVLVHLYEEQGWRFLTGVNGMLAVMIVDTRRRKVVLARDRFGIKPVYFHCTADRVVAASEIKALFADPATPRQVDWQAAIDSPFFASVPVIDDKPNSTWFRGIETVEPGTVVEIDMLDGSRTVHRYWTMPTEADHTRTAADFIADYRDLLVEAVRDCATADAEVGLFLSGGIDSSAVAALGNDVAPMQSFTALNAGTFANGDSRYAHLMAAQLGMPNHQVLFDTTRIPAVEEWLRLVWQVETPLCGPEVYYKHELHRFARSVRPDLKAMLLGAASDEFNGGYSVEITGDRGAGWGRFEDALGARRMRGASRTRPGVGLWLGRGGEPWFTAGVLGTEGDHYAEFLRSEWRKVEQYNVWHEDRTAAGSGIEARVPFLDHRLVELVASVPTELRPTLLWDKRILREAMRPYLPSEVVEREKVPFFYGQGLESVYRSFLSMMQQDSAALVALAMEQPITSSFVDREVVMRLVADLTDRPGSAEVELLLRVVNFGLLESMTADVPAARVDLPTSAVPLELTVDDWDTAECEIAELFGTQPQLLLDWPVELATNVILAADSARPGVHYLIMDGEIEYVIDDDAPANWLALLQAADGVTTLGELIAQVGATVEDMREVLQDALAAAVLTVPAPEAAAEGAGASPELTTTMERSLN